MRILITGGTGYIGKRLVALAEHAGHAVIVASRSRPVGSCDVWLHFDLQDGAGGVQLPDNVDVVVHLAANTAISSDAEAANELAVAMQLIRLARAGGARVVFVSSQTARGDAPTLYGRLKWKIEREVLLGGGTVVRPGQVYGGPLNGLFGAIVALVNRLPILPAFVPSPLVQPIHVDDLCDGLLRVACSKNSESSIYSLASAEPVRFSCFLAAVAKYRLRKRRMFFPVPTPVLSTLSRVIGNDLSNRVGLARLRSLFDLPVMDTRSDLKRISLVLRKIDAGLHPSGDDRRRTVILEGCALLTYVLRRKPSAGLLARYVRVIERLRDGTSLNLPAILLVHPVLLSVVTDSILGNDQRATEYRWRLDTATLLAESTPLGADRFLGMGRTSTPRRAAMQIVYAALCEAAWRIVRTVMSPVLRYLLRQQEGVR